MLGMMVICVINMLLAHSSYSFHFPLKFHAKRVCSWWNSVIFTMYHAFAGLMVCISIGLHSSLITLQGDESNDSSHAYHIANIRHMMQIPLQASSFPATNFQGGQQ